MATKPLQYFKIPEFACKHCRENLIDYNFVAKLDDLRHAFGKPLAITSGYRCPDHNVAVSSTGTHGPHTTGHAADLAVNRGDALMVLRIALSMGFTGVGVQQKGASRFIHLDDLTNTVAHPRPTIWSY